MGIVSGGAGGGGPAAGSYLPAGGPSTLNTTTYNDGITGVGKLRTDVTAVEDVVLAAAILGDAFPRVAISSDPTDYGVMLNDGAHDIFGNTSAVLSLSPTAFVISAGSARTEVSLGGSKPLRAGAPTDPSHAALVQNVSPYLTVTSGALSTVQLVSGTARQFVGAASGDAETLTPVTFNPTAGAAATCKVELSPDNVTYSTLGIATEPAGIALDGTIQIVKVRCPLSWYLKLTATNAVLGLTTYY